MAPVFFPLDQQLILAGSHWSEGLTKLAVWLSGLVDFTSAAEILQQVGQMTVSTTTVWRLTQAWGERFQGITETERAQANQVRGSRPRARQSETQRPRLGVAMDGVMIHIRQEGWKEVKMGCVFELGTRVEVDKQTGDELELAQACHNSYVSHLGGPEVFGELLWAEAQRRDWDSASATQVIGDGAPWVWNLTGTHFYHSHQVVDWYHGTEHLALAARLLYGEGTPAMQHFYRQWETTLYQGHALRLATQLEALADQQPKIASELRREAGYFGHNYRRMNYLELRSEGWVIGSGMVESAGKQLKARLAGPGMQWSRSGAERLLPLRTAIMGGRFDELWQCARNSPPN